LDDDNRVLRCEQHAMPAVRAHFGLGVNYVESLVNRHRVEAFVLDATGRVTVAFERLQWDEADVVHHLLAALDRTSTTNASRPSRGTVRRSVAAVIPSVLGSSPSLAVAFLPKCPICWAAYLSLFGIAGLERLAYAWWLIPALWAAMVVNVATLWLRGRSSGRMLPCYLGAAGAFAIGVLGMHWEVPWSRPIGVVLTLVASLLAAVGPGAVRRRALRPS
jgi:protein SCO1/2